MIAIYDATPYAGKRIHIHSAMKIEGVQNAAAMSVYIDHPFDHARKDQQMVYDGDYVSGNSPWTNLDFVVDVPMIATRVNLMVLQPAIGKTWFTNPTIEIVGTDTPVTNKDFPAGHLGFAGHHGRENSKPIKSTL